METELIQKDWEIRETGNCVMNEKNTENKIEDKAESRIEWLEEKFHEAVWNRLLMLARWLIFAALTGIVLGLVGTAFGKGVELATAFRTEHFWLILGLPLVGLAIV